MTQKNSINFNTIEEFINCIDNDFVLKYSFHHEKILFRKDYGETYGIEKVGLFSKKQTYYSKEEFQSIIVNDYFIYFSIIC